MIDASAGFVYVKKISIIDVDVSNSYLEYYNSNEDIMGLAKFY